MFSLSIEPHPYNPPSPYRDLKLNHLFSCETNFLFSGEAIPLSLGKDKYLLLVGLHGRCVSDQKVTQQIWHCGPKLTSMCFKKFQQQIKLTLYVFEPAILYKKPACYPSRKTQLTRRFLKCNPTHASVIYELGKTPLGKIVFDATLVCTGLRTYVSFGFFANLTFFLFREERSRLLYFEVKLPADKLVPAGEVQHLLLV